jgi:hypothetical protein
MKRTVLFAALVAISSLAFGCGRSGHPPEGSAKSVESFAGDQTTKPTGSEASTPADEPQAVTVRQEEKITEGEQISLTVEAGCGKCMFKMKGIDSCELAIALDGKAYLVTGAYVDPTESGLCKTVKKAQIVGRLVRYGDGLTLDEQQGEFIAQSIQLQE